METTKLSSKGQVILPKSIRAAHNWDAGVEFAIEDTPNGILLRPLKPFPSTRLKDVYGCGAYRGTAKTVQDMEVAIQRAVKDRHARGRY
ncbi:MAG: AbrB/MazE/SpoVT family DNA-binding domain-containing protein [Nitrospirota bacterium]